MSFWCLQILKKPEFFSRISDLASKKWSYRKDKVTKWRILFWISYTTFLIWPLFRDQGRNPGNFFVSMYLEKGHFKINWPLMTNQITKKTSLRMLRNRISNLMGMGIKMRSCTIRRKTKFRHQRFKRSKEFEENTGNSHTL